ncbi:MAG TPA: alkaline phosphatase PhoX [Thermoanaerobaculia bacterium]|jgi:hypothetical protein
MLRAKWVKVSLFAGAILFAVLGGANSAELRKIKRPGEPAAFPKVTGNSAPNALATGLAESPAAQGSQPLENGTVDIPYYGYHGDGPMVPAPGDVQAPGHNVEASKSEPDKNTYLVLNHQHGSDPNYDYGHHFLYQGHELGIGYITRVNLDADHEHRITLFATTDNLGNPIPEIDGSTWDPWAQRLLFTAELGADGGVFQSTLDFPPIVEDISGILGRAGYEGIQNDSDGNLWICEDTSGAKGTVNDHARQPNSFIFRFLPTDKTDLKAGGKLQALQVMSLANPGQPIVFHAGQADADILSQDVKDLHTFGKQFQTNWVTVHDTAVDGTTPFDANALAKTKLATPFKRPENAQFRPGQQFREFFFDATGDTDAATQAGSQYGGFGAIFKLTQSSPSANSGVLKLFYRGDIDHTAFDNVAFWDKDRVIFVEDRGDGLHTAHNAYDSAWLFDVRTDYGNPNNQPFRTIALGRDSAATIDSALSGGAPGNGFQNEGDNEITGIHISNGDPTEKGILGAQEPNPFHNGWRIFYTQQHGDNVTWEILPAPVSHMSPAAEN